MVARVICFLLGHAIDLVDARPNSVVRCVRCRSPMFMIGPGLDEPDTLDDCPHPQHKHEDPK